MNYLDPLTGLNLSSGGLLGSLSPSIGNLSFLREIWIFPVKFHLKLAVSLDYEYYVSITTLFRETFRLSYPIAPTSKTFTWELLRRWECGIPPFIRNLTLLNTLSLANWGLVPDFFHRLSSLRRIALPGNDLVGTIPPSLYGLSSLEELYLDYNKLTGRLPSNLGLILPRLRILSLNDNQLTGPLPPSVLSSSALEILDVTQNSLSVKVVITSREACNLSLFGEDDEKKFIDALSFCSKLEVLDIGNNQMRGFLPESLWNLSTNLSFLSLASNAFSGDVPSSVGNLSSLTSLDLSRNIPGSLGNISSLIELHLGLNGTIPSSLGKCTGLTLDQNNLTGEKPRQLFELSSLSISLNLGNNHFTGQLPPENLIMLFFVFYQQKRKVKLDLSEPICSESLIQVSYKMLYEATDGFSTRNFIGEGSFSSIYRGCLDKDGMVVAVKVLNLHHRGDSKSFIPECEALRNARHRNLAKVITCCSSFDFQGNKFKAIVPRLGLLQRVRIALDVAYALDYLHRHVGQTIIHWDIKPSNILLDKNLVAHVGDFGLSKILHSEYQFAYLPNEESVMTSWNNDSLSFCQWRGITCGPRHQRVTVLNLTSCGLFGTLSPSMGNLSFLREIHVQNNSFSGEIPPEVGRLFRLQVLRLNNNSFVGNIPASISNCSNLQVLHLGFNNLVGKIPDEIGSLSNLNLLITHRNRLAGGFPRFIGNLTSLQTLSFADCGLGGSIPDIFHQLTSLTRIAIPGNNFVGTVPPSLYNLSSLEQLFIDNNQLTGTLPTNLGSFQPGLRVLSLNDNRFTGPLPPSILSSSELAILDVARNNLSGKIVITSRQVCNLLIVSLSSNQFGSGDEDEMEFIDAMSICRELEVLDVGYNQLRGFMPESLGNLSTKLYFLSFASNAFSGRLPSSVAKLSNLTSLDLSSNQLTGTIPADIGNLQNLRRLDLKQNNFSGNIPGSLGNLSLLIDLHLGSNQLNGAIPSSLGKCKRLIGLTLDQNNLSGVIPRQLFELSSLSITLNLGSNQLSGLIPQEIGTLQNINEIIFANNRLSGELPSSLGSCSSLQNLDVSNNFFRGVLPSSLRSLRALENLDISHNNFTGHIPSYLEAMPLENLNISFNGFEGEVLKRGVFSNASAVSIVGNTRLCGGISELRLSKCSSKKKNRLSLAVILVISIISVLLCAAVVLFFVFYRRKREVQDDPLEQISGDSLLQVSYEMLHKATDGFSGKNFIGEGSFSSVYRGYLGKEGVVVAVKVLNLHRRGGSKSFISECEALRNARHRNLAKVVTCCSGIDFQGNEFKAIVYEFMSNGSLDQWLHNEQDEVPRLSLLQRVCIALDVAYALDYLHHRAGKTIVHCDLKPSNILLDEDMVAHVGDFGLSKILHSEYQNRQHSSSAGVRGTIGYAAPEYGVGSKVSTSGDLYSFGILLLEMMTSKRPTDAIFGDGLSLHNYAKKAMDDDGALEIINDDNGERNNEGESTAFMKNKACLRLLLEIGVSCSMDSPQHRMGMTRVIQELQLIKDAILGDFSISHSFQKPVVKTESAALLVG
ncbi:Concanavalin A-like lectin/glucanase, subgroup [Cynara cardunculus var. scolymus]|uniref:non-specific serine/threonine protein kinase n=1 Tax=Cynara cardunculus var. scolymus TaxID=59895 RepID=A0A103YBW8_CYNCS|nr:Concanavalin A-like lectin/glucanase, subgroup [Cynara cardunculus var. scolymus]